VSSSIVSGGGKGTKQQRALAKAENDDDVARSLSPWPTLNAPSSLVRVEREAPSDDDGGGGVAPQQQQDRREHVLAQLLGSRRARIQAARGR
jgi:hypothetical protein